MTFSWYSFIHICLYWVCYNLEQCQIRQIHWHRISTDCAQTQAKNFKRFVLDSTVDGRLKQLNLLSCLLPILLSCVLVLPLSRLLSLSLILRVSFKVHTTPAHYYNSLELCTAQLASKGCVMENAKPCTIFGFPKVNKSTRVSSLWTWQLWSDFPH